MKRAFWLCVSTSSLALLLLSCGSNSNAPGTSTSGVKFRVFVSQDVNASTVSAGLQIIDAQKDVRAFVSPIAAGNTPGMMVETPNRALTLAFSPSGNALAIVSNTKETTSGTVSLPGPTESIVISPDSSTAYVAVPGAPVANQSPGAIEIVNLASGTISGEISCPPVVQNPPVCAYLGTSTQGSNPAYRYLAINHSGNRLLAFGAGAAPASSEVAIVTPSNVGTQDPMVTFIAGFDHPVAAFFSTDDNTAYVINCGRECGGTQSSVQTIDLTTTPPTVGTAISVPAARTMLVVGTTLYLAGTPVPASPCTGQTTAATTCGLLTTFDLNTMTPSPNSVVITDGVHDRIAMGANGQLFVGGNTCTEIIPPIPPPTDAEVRGCLSIVNTNTGAVVIPPANGDVTGIQPIEKRTVVYVIQGGELQIYDTTTDKLQPTQIDISGHAVDVKEVDF